MSSRRMNNIEILSEQLGSLQIMEETSNNYKQMNIEISVAPVLAPAPISENIQAEIPKNMVLDPG